MSRTRMRVNYIKSKPEKIYMEEVYEKFPGDDNPVIHENFLFTKWSNAESYLLGYYYAKGLSEFDAFILSNSIIRDGKELIENK